MSEKLFCGCGVRVVEFNDLEKHGKLHDRITELEKALDEARKALSKIAGLPQKTVRNPFDYEEIAKKALVKINAVAPETGKEKP